MHEPGGHAKLFALLTSRVTAAEVIDSLMCPSYNRYVTLCYMFM